MSEASKKIEEVCLLENNRILQELSNMQTASVNAKKELNGYVEKVTNSYLEGTFLSAESKTTMEDCLLEW